MKSFKLASFNIGASGKMFNRYDIKDLYAIADLIKKSEADIVALQEVDKSCERSERVNMASFISGKAGYGYYHFITIRPFQGGKYGTAIISKYPIVRRKTINYKVSVATQGTSCGYVTVMIDGEPVTVFNTHLSVESEAANLDTMRCLNDELKKYHTANGRLICCGDFNTLPAVIEKNVTWLSLANHGINTWEDRAIDNILYSDGYEISDVRTLDATTEKVSDHDMLICKVGIK